MNETGTAWTDRHVNTSILDGKQVFDSVTAAEDNMKSKLRLVKNRYRERPHGTYITGLPRTRPAANKKAVTGNDLMVRM